jgi:hypothetical protein
MSQTDTSKILVRIPADVRQWLERQASLNLSPMSSEIVRALRYRMESLQQPEKVLG